MDAAAATPTQNRPTSGKPDFDALKSRQQAAWSSGDYALIGTTLQIVGEELCEALDVRAGQRVLDVAAGNGNVSLAAARRGCEVLASDYVPALLERARERAQAERLNIEFRQADAEALPFADGAFGVVLCVDVLEHVNAVPAVREIHRVLAPGGVAVVSAVHFTSRNLYVDPTHVRGFSVRTFEFFAPPAGDRPRNWHRSYYFDFAFSRVDSAAVQFESTLGKGRYLVWDRLLEPCINWKPALQDAYEMTFVARLFPAANVLVAMTK